jgi:predicted Zn-dependent peptidase
LKPCVQKTVLENGIRVLSQRMDGARSVSVGVLVDVGSKDEGPSERGYAHLLEHMLFQGTTERDSRTIAEMMEIGGGAIGAFTARDYTVYHATVLDDYLPFALEVLGDMLGNSILPADALQRQQSVILNEIASRDDALETANDRLKSTLWPDHPLGYPTVGVKDSIQQVTRERLAQFMQQHYTSDNLIMAAAGNVEHDHLAAQAQDCLWQMRRGSQRSVLAAPESHLGTMHIENRDLPQVTFALGWPAPAYTSLDRYAWHVFSALLGGGTTSRLYRRLREDLGLVYHAAAQYHAYGTAGALVVEGATLPQTLVSTLANILIEVFRLSEDPITADEHHRTVQSLVSQHLISGDSAYVRMSRLAMQELYFERALCSDEVVAGLRAQPVESVRQIAQSICMLGLPAITLVGPVSTPILQATYDMLVDFGETPTIPVTSNGHSVPLPAQLSANNEHVIRA